MSNDQSPNLGLDYIADNQAQKNVTMNEDLGILDTVVQLAVLAADLTTPPPSSPGPEEGDRYIVAGPATGAWAGHDEDVAYYRDGAWQFVTPKVGWLAFDVSGDTALFYASGGWTSYNDVIISGITALQNLTLLGVNTTADATNPFASLGPGALFTAKTAGAGGTGDLSVTLNKEADADTLQLILQKGFSTRAILGLLANNDLTLKVSANGSDFFDVLVVDDATGHITTLGAITTNPSTLPAAPSDTKLWIAGDDGVNPRLVLDGFAAPGNFIFRHAAGTAAAPTATQASTNIGQFSWFARGATGYSSGARAQVGANATQNWTDTAQGTELVFRVTPAGAAAVNNTAILRSTGLTIDSTASATFDTNNALSVKGTNVLFNSAGSIDAAFSKNAAGNDASFTFKTNFSARALLGLLGNDDFTFKVSPDGSSYFTGLVIDKDDGTVSLPANPKFSAYTNFENYVAAATPTKVQFNAEEADPQSVFNTSTNRFVAPIAGVYTFGFSLLFKKNGANNPTALTAQFYKNGAAAGRGRSGIATPVDGVSTVHATTTLTLAAADYVEIFATFTGTDGYIDDLDSIFWGHLDA